MGKGILTFRDVDIEKNQFYHYKSPIFLKNVDTEKVLDLKRFLLVKKAISTLLVTCIMKTKLSPYI